MESKKTFGEYIRERRKELGMTQKEFSEKLYVTESAVSKWERGMSYPDITLLLDICAALDAGRRLGVHVSESLLMKHSSVAQTVAYWNTRLNVTHCTNVLQRL